MTRRYFSFLADEEVDSPVSATEIPRLAGNLRHVLAGG
jgi:hypothetical protein